MLRIRLDLTMIIGYSERAEELITRDATEIIFSAFFLSYFFFLYTVTQIY